MRLALAALAVLLCCPAAATAAPFAEPPFLPIAGDRTATCLQALGGDRVAVVGTDDRRRGAVELLRVGADGALVPDGTVPIGVSHSEPDAPTPCPSVAAAASGAAVVGSVRFTRRGGTLGVAVRDPGGAFGRARRIPVPRRAFADAVRAAVAPDGTAVVTWSESLGGFQRIRATRRAPGGAFGPPVTLSDRAYPLADPVAGIDDAGAVTVAWVGEDRDANGNPAPEVATAAPGAAFGAPQRLPASDVYEQLSLAVAADGGTLLAFRDAPGIRVFERPPGAAALARVAAYPRAPERERPVVALAPGGGAILAWLRLAASASAEASARTSGGGAILASLHDGVGAVVEVSARAPGGAFQAPQVLDAMTPGATGWSALAPLPAFTPRVEDGPLQAAVGADGTAVVGWLESVRVRPGLESRVPVRAGLAAGTLAAGWEGTALLGGPGRSADGLAVLASPAAALWTDNLLGTVFGDPRPVRSGRLHRALPGVVPQPEPAPPPVTLSARRQRIRAGQPVIVRARCSAACDLHAVSRRAHGVGAAELDGPGTARIALHPLTGDSFLTGGSRSFRVTVHATAPGGRRETVARIAVRVAKD